MKLLAPSSPAEVGLIYGEKRDLREFDTRSSIAVMTLVKMGEYKPKDNLWRNRNEWGVISGEFGLSGC